MLDLLWAAANQGTGRRAALSTPTFGKTGTTQNNRDALFIGFAGDLVVGVWVGRDDNQSLGKITGGTAPANIWRQFMVSALSVDGRQLVGEDMLLPAGRRKRAAPFAIRFHLAPDVEVTLTADNQGALLRIDGGPLWQFRCKGGALGVEESLWVDGAGRPRETQQLVVSAQSPAGGANVSWLFKRAG